MLRQIRAKILTNLLLIRIHWRMDRLFVMNILSAWLVKNLR